MTDALDDGSTVVDAIVVGIGIVASVVEGAVVAIAVMSSSVVGSIYPTRLPSLTLLYVLSQGNPASCRPFSCPAGR